MITIPDINIAEYYVRQQDKFGAKVGDTVKVCCSCKSHANGWPNTWEPGMDDCIDKSDKIYSISNSGIYIFGWSFPYFVLEILK